MFRKSDLLRTFVVAVAGLLAVALALALLARGPGHESDDEGRDRTETDRPPTRCPESQRYPG